jgi:ubiquinone/menaquinone biosynthesis C-methylase UbiE
MARIKEKPDPYILDICCGTGAVTAAFAVQFPQSLITVRHFS